MTRWNTPFHNECDLYSCFGPDFIVNLVDFEYKLWVLREIHSFSTSCVLRSKVFNVLKI